MLRRIALASALLLIFSMSAFAQGFNALWVYIPDYGGAPLTTTCGGSTPIPDGRIVKIFWDVDSDGVDLTDPQPTVCNNPPLCEDGPVGTVSLNEFTMNGAVYYSAGYFYQDMVFASVGVIPTPPRYYLRVYDVDGTTVLWTSSVQTLNTSDFTELNLLQSDWTCGSTGPQCVVRDEHE